MEAEEFRDTYTEVLRQAIEAKVEGKEFELHARTEAADRQSQ